MVVPLASLIFSPVSEPVKPGDVPAGLFVTENNATHFVVRARYTRPVPWDTEKRFSDGHPRIPDL